MLLLLPNSGKKLASLAGFALVRPTTKIKIKTERWMIVAIELNVDVVLCFSKH